LDILCIDFETFYSRDYSLTKLTTEEYIRDQRFEVIGVSIKKNDEPTVWFSGTKEDTKKFLEKWDWELSVALAHNAMFDLAILSWVFNIKPKRIADTLSMARALNGPGVSVSLGNLVKQYGVGEKGDEVIMALGKRRLDFDRDELARYGEYCRNDVELTYKLWKILATDFPVSELRLIDLTIRMFSEPVLELHKGKLLNHRDEVVRMKEDLLSLVVQDKKDIMSNEKFAQVLRLQGVEPPTKTSPTTGKETYAFAKTDEEFLELQSHPSLTVQALVAARLGLKSTLEETRTQRFIDISARGALPVPLRYYAAHTGRWGGSDKINLQNLTRGSQIKKCIFAPEGFVFCDSDSSQIEARTLAWLAGQLDLVDAFEKWDETKADSDDVYRIMASNLYGKPVTDINKTERFTGKTVTLGAGYGLGWNKFQTIMKKSQMNISDDESQRVIQTYRKTYEKIPQLWKQAQDVIMAMAGDRSIDFGPAGVLQVEGLKGIKLPNGLYLNYPNLRWEEEEGPTNRPQFYYDTNKGRAVVKTKIYGGKLVENVCQALARIIIGEQMLQISKKYRVALTVHDSVGSLLPRHEEVTGKEYVEICMRIRPDWALDLPLNCEAGTGTSYGYC